MEFPLRSLVATLLCVVVCSAPRWATIDNASLSEGSGDGCFKGSEEGLGRVLKVALPWFCDVAVYE